MKASEYSFTAVSFRGVRRKITAPVAVAVRPSGAGLVVVRVNLATCQRCDFAAGDLLVPFVDKKARAILLLGGVRPVPESARPIRIKARDRTLLEINFPRVGPLKDIFPALPMRAMELREASPGRLVFTVPPAP